MKKKQANKGGCLTIFGILLIIGWTVNLFNGKSNSGEDTNQNRIENLSESIESSSSTTQEQYKGYTEEIVTIFKDLGLNPNDYVSEDVSTSRIEYRGTSKVFTNNYQNMTIDKLTTVFSDVSINAKSIIDNLGRPDSIVIDNNFRNDGKTTYGMQAYWQQTEGGNKLTTSVVDYIEVQWPVSKDSNDVKSVSGTPVDSPVGYQSIVELGEFKGVQ